MAEDIGEGEQTVGQSTKTDPSVEGDVHAEHTVAQHEHGVDCGHDAVEHDGHVDFEHDGHRHSRHGDHYDEH